MTEVFLRHLPLTPFHKTHIKRPNEYKETCECCKERPTCIMRIGWIKSCRHNTQRFARIGRSTLLPLEVMLHIRDQIVDGYLLYLFDTALFVTPCSSLFCNRLLMEQWFETEMDVISIAECEYNKQLDRPPYSIRHCPSFYMIQRIECGFKMTVLKQHPFHYRFTLHLPLYTDPMNGSVDYLPSNVYLIYNPTRIMELFPGEMTYSKDLLQNYKSICRWFASGEKKKREYAGWDGESFIRVDRNPFRGRCWIYPEKVPSLTANQHSKPCVQWVQTLYDLYMEQRKRSKLFLPP